MPRYFFDLRDGDFVPDQIGTPLRDVEAARLYAVMLISGLLRDNPRKFWTGDAWKVEVRTEDGATLFTLQFLATEGYDAPQTTASALD
jgi:hypothetical protein